MRKIMSIQQGKYIKGLTNQVFIYESPKQKIIFLPAYLRIKVKNFTDMSLQTLTSELNGTLEFTVHYGNLGMIHEKLVEQLLYAVSLHFNLNEPSLLNDQGVEVQLYHQPQWKAFTYKVRKLFKLIIHSEIFWSPFQILYNLLSVTVQTVNIKIGKQTYSIKFNLMDHGNCFQKVTYSEEGTFGNYDIAEAKLNCQYTNSRLPSLLKTQEQIMKEQKNKKQLEASFSEMNLMDPEKRPLKLDKTPKNFQFAHFSIPIYKFPSPTLATIFLPLWLLAIITLGIFFQANNMAKRLQNIAAVMVSYVALLPTIRQQIPPSPRVTFIQILVYITSSTSLICLFETLIIRPVGDSTQQPFYDGFTDTYFIVSLVITIVTVVAVVVLISIHKLIWEPNYNRRFSDESQQAFNRQNWVNPEADKYFTFYKNNLMEITQTGQIRKIEQSLQFSELT